MQKQFPPPPASQILPHLADAWGPPPADASTTLEPWVLNAVDSAYPTLELLALVCRLAEPSQWRHFSDLIVNAYWVRHGGYPEPEALANMAKQLPPVALEEIQYQRKTFYAIQSFPTLTASFAEARLLWPTLKARKLLDDELTQVAETITDHLFIQACNQRDLRSALRRCSSAEPLCHYAHVWLEGELVREHSQLWARRAGDALQSLGWVWTVLKPERAAELVEIAGGEDALRTALIPS